MEMTTLAHPLELELHDAPVQPRLRIGGAELFDDLAEPWNRLCREAKAEPFLSPEWIRCYLQAFEPDTEIIVTAVLCGERMLAVLPLTRKRTWYRGVPLIELKGAANAHSVWFDILRAPGGEGEGALQRIWAYLRDLPGWHVLQVPLAPENGAAHELRLLAQKGGYLTFLDHCADSPYVNLEPDEQGTTNIFADTSRHFRHELRRFARLLEKEMGDKPEFLAMTSVTPEEWAEFVDLEAAGWKGEIESAIRCSAATESFYHQIKDLTIRKQMFRLYTLKLRGRMIAACSGVVGAGVFRAMKLTHDESLRRCAPGHLLMQGLLEDCASRGYREMSLGGKADEYKRRWTSRCHTSFNFFVFNRCARAKVVYYERSQIFPALRKWIVGVQARYRSVLREVRRISQSLRGRYRQNGETQ